MKILQSIFIVDNSYREFDDKLNDKAAKFDVQG